MGYPYNDLIAPAILFDNPGITREEFVELLDQTHSSHMPEYKNEDPWNYYAKEQEDDRYHQGLEGLAGLLRLEYSSKYKKFGKPTTDENGLLIHSPYMLPITKFTPDELRPVETKYKFEVRIHTKNVVESPKVIKKFAWGKLKVGNIWEECQLGEERGIVTKIFKEKYIGSKEEDDPLNTSPQYEYKMEIKPFHGEDKRELFKSEEELYKKWPQFHPDFIFNWAQERGSFAVFLREKNFLWLKKDKRYFLDDETFNRIPISFRSSHSFGYTDLILTSEAIKHKAWKILSYKGLKHFPAFLRDFPDVKVKYERAVLDFYISDYAKQKGMSISDFLRMHLTF